MLKTIFIFFGMVLPSVVYAEKVQETNSKLVLGLSGSPSWASGNKTQTISLQSDIVKTYTSGNSNDVFPSIELFIGWQKPATRTLVSQFGLSVVGAGNAKLTGDIWEDADPNFNNFNYSYKINHMHVAFKGRLIGNYGLIVDPYISGSLGVGFNHAYDFTINPNISEEVPAPAFTSNTTTTFSYTLGIGVQKAFTETLRVAIGYEFTDWGQINLSPAVGQTSNNALTLNHLYVNALQLSLFYT